MKTYIVVKVSGEIAVEITTDSREDVVAGFDVVEGATDAVKEALGDELGCGLTFAPAKMVRRRSGGD